MSQNNRCLEINRKQNEPHREKNMSSGFPTRYCTNRAVQPQKMARYFGFWKERDCTIYVAKTKALISCLITAKSRFSHDAAQI